MLRTKREVNYLIVDQNLTRDEVKSIISELNYAENYEEHFISYYSNKIRIQHIIERILMKCITSSFKVSMMRIDQILEDVDENNYWLQRERSIDAVHRQNLLRDIDSFSALRRRR